MERGSCLAINGPLFGDSEKSGIHVSFAAGECCPAFRLPDAHRSDSICLRCYARSTAQARSAAQPFYRQCLELWTNDPVTYWRRFHYGASRQERVRAFMSGDAPCPDYLRELYLACQRLPGVRFWVSTKCIHVPAFHEVLGQLCTLANVAVRSCAVFINTDIRGEVGRTLPMIPGMVYSAVVPPENLDDWRGRGHICPAILAPKGQRSCKAQHCSACWDRDVEMVIYPLH